MSEADVGITIYLNENPEFVATYKHRMTDFIVEEISLDGKVVQHNSDYKNDKLKRTNRNPRQKHLRR